MSRHLTPLEVVERLIAPAKHLGGRLGYHAKSAYHWRAGSRWRDPGDMPPAANRRALLVAELVGAPLVPRHLIWGASAEEIEALEAALAAGISPATLRAAVADGPEVLLSGAACPEAAE